jgi:hypothetical protein
VTDFFSAADDFLNTACTTTTTLLTTDPHVHEHNHNHAIVLGGVTACTTIATTVSSGRRGVNIPPAPRERACALFRQVLRLHTVTDSLLGAAADWYSFCREVRY